MSSLRQILNYKILIGKNLNKKYKTPKRNYSCFYVHLVLQFISNQFSHFLDYVLFIFAGFEYFIS